MMNSVSYKILSVNDRFDLCIIPLICFITFILSSFASILYCIFFMIATIHSNQHNTIPRQDIIFSACHNFLFRLLIPHMWLNVESRFRIYWQDVTKTLNQTKKRVIVDWFIILERVTYVMVSI